MTDNSITRRVFLVASAATVASVAASHRAIARDLSRREPRGAVPARTGSAGLPPGTADAPSQGVVTLLDGHTLAVTHRTSWGIGPRKTVLVAPEVSGGWSVLYAEE